VRIVMHAREGETGAAIAQRLGYTDRAMRKWIRRYNEDGLDGLRDLPRSGRPRRLEPALEEEVRQRLDAGAQPKDGVCTLRGEDVRRILAEADPVRIALPHRRGLPRHGRRGRDPHSHPQRRRRQPLPRGARDPDPRRHRPVFSLKTR
jgi:transposase